MQLKSLGRTDLRVTDICLGTMTWGSQNTEAEGHAQIDMGLDAGLNFMDTAELYAVPGNAERSGRTEEIIGNWFQKTGKREKWILASKIAGGGSAHIRGGAKPDGASIRIALEQSLKRLKTDYLDLYQIHWAPRGHYNFENGWTYAPHIQDVAAAKANILDMLQVLAALVKEGKIRHVGVSNETSWGIMTWLALAQEHNLPRLVSVQNEYSLLRRQHDLDMAEVSNHEGVGLMAFSPLAGGLLTGKYQDGTTPKGSRGDFQGAFWRKNPQSLAATGEYLALAKAHGLDPAQMALAFARSRPFMMSVIIGATSTEQLATNLGARDMELSPEVLAGIEAIHRKYPRPI